MTRVDRLICLANIAYDSENIEVFKGCIISIAKSKSAPTDKKLWNRAKSEAKKKFDVYPSAYANAWAAKWYKSKGGGWREEKKKTNKAEDPMYLGNLTKVQEYSGRLLDILETMEENDVPEWVEAKIVQIADDIGEVYHYLEDHHHRKEAVYRDSGLGRWFEEKWVDVSRKDKSGKHPECGRSDTSKGGYPKCRPSKKVTKETPETTKSMSKEDKESATSQKRQDERKSKSKGKGRKPNYDRHRKKD